MSKFDKAATVTWFPGSNVELLPAEERGFETLREAILFFKTLTAKTRQTAIIHSDGMRYGISDIDRLEKEMRQKKSFD